MGLESFISQTPNLSKRRFLNNSALLTLALGAATLGIKPGISYASSKPDTSPGEPPCSRINEPVTQPQVEAAIGMRMSTLHDHYEEYKPNPACGIVDFDTRLKRGSIPIPAMLYPGMLKEFPKNWSQESLDILYDLSVRLPGYYAPDHLIQPALLVLSTGDSVNTPKPPLNQGIVTFRPETMRNNDIQNAVRIYVHEGAHLRDPMTRRDGAGYSCTGCLAEVVEDACSEQNNKLTSDSTPPTYSSTLHDLIYSIFPGSSFDNPPPAMKEWADHKYEEFKLAGKLGSMSPYDPVERLVYSIKQKYPVELIGVATEFMVQNGPDYDFLMEIAKPLVEAGVLTEEQVVSLRRVIATDGPLKGRTLNELSCYFN